MSYRTDLALEALEMTQRSTRRAAAASGVTRSEQTLEGFSVTRVDILSEEGAQEIGKPVGAYQTLDLGALIRREEDAFPRACRALADLVHGLIGQVGSGPVLVAGLGNRSITPDAIGPQSADYVIATRHLTKQAPEYFSDWRPVSAISPGVLGQTGVETSEMISGLLQTIQPAAVIAVDALAAGRLSRLLKTIQITNTGIVPGSGVGNARAALNQNTLGIPVLAVGVPTVVDGATLAHEIRAQSGMEGCEALDDLATPMVVTTRDIDREVSDVSRVIGYAINLALHPHLSVEDVDLYLS